jgi:thioredoxin-like negative regulator of GroEL
VQFLQGYEEGYRLAHRQGKPVLIFFIVQWCDYCRSMTEETFADQQVIRLAEQFVCVLVDADAAPYVCQEFRVRHYPTIQFLSPRGVPLKRLRGKQTVGQLVVEMRAALQAIARRTSTPDQALQR